MRSDAMWWQKRRMNVYDVLFIVHNLPRNYLKPVFCILLIRYGGKTIQKNSSRCAQRHYVHCKLNVRCEMKKSESEITTNSFNFKSFTFFSYNSDVSIFIVCKHLMFVHVWNSFVAISIDCIRVVKIKTMLSRKQERQRAQHGVYTKINEIEKIENSS